MRLLMLRIIWNIQFIFINNMNQEIKQLEEEKQRLIKEIEELDKINNEIRNQKFTRIVEIQGIIKYLNTKEKEK